MQNMSTESRLQRAAVNRMYWPKKYGRSLAQLRFILQVRDAEKLRYTNRKRNPSDTESGVQ